MEDNRIQVNIGNRIKKLRQERELTQKELASALGVGASTIGMYETGKRSLDNEMLSNMSNYFGVSSDYLLCISDIRNPKGLQEKAKTKANEILSAFEESGIDISTINIDILKALLESYKILDKKK